jgi:hypothetical protein
MHAVHGILILYSREMGELEKVQRRAARRVCGYFRSYMLRKQIIYVRLPQCVRHGTGAGVDEAGRKETNFQAG